MHGTHAVIAWQKIEAGRSVGLFGSQLGGGSRREALTRRAGRAHVRCFSRKAQGYRI
jgi:hypothetical protein